MKKIAIILLLLLSVKLNSFALMDNDFSFLEDITVELYNENVPIKDVPEHIKSIEEQLMFEVLHATYTDNHWVVYTLNKNLLGTYKVGQPALLNNGTVKKMYFVGTFSGTVGGLDIYVSEYKNDAWSKPKNLGKSINTTYNESNPGLLNEHTLTYSSNGIIKKFDLNTLEVADVVKENKVVIPTKEEIVKEIPKEVIAETPAKETPIKLKEETKKQPITAPVISQSVKSTSSEMLKSVGLAIQLGAFLNPNWTILNQFSSLGKLISFKNENGVNIVWLTGFADRTAAEATLAKVRSAKGFEKSMLLPK